MAVGWVVNRPNLFEGCRHAVMQEGGGGVDVVEVRDVEEARSVVGLFRAHIVALAIGVIRRKMAGDAAGVHGNLAAVVGCRALEQDAAPALGGRVGSVGSVVAVGCAGNGG